jgi:Holliday junction resolvasome RuvABC endonuclease subunit
MILGFDLSTTVCGYCVLNDNGEIECLSYYSFKSKEMIEKAKELKQLIIGIYAEYLNIDKFFIEERLQGFRAGGTNADAMFKTAALNFHCQVLINQFETPIVALNVNNARSVSFPGFHKFARTVKGTKHKEIIFKMVKEKLGDKYFPTKTMKSGKRKGDVVYIDEAMDMADAYVIALAGYKK